jgi:hypothetical protein
MFTQAPTQKLALRTLSSVLALSCAFASGAHAQSGGVLSSPQALPGAPGSLMNGPRAKFEPAGDAVYHGASVPKTWEDVGLRNELDRYKQFAGKKLSVVTWFASTYENGRLTSWKQNYLSNLHRVKKAGAISLIKFSSQDHAYPSTKRIAKTSDIARGVYDAYFNEFADTMKLFGNPVFVSINHEMNGTWYPYSEGFAGSGVTAADFVAAWRRVAGIFKARGASNVAWVWSPNVPDVGPVPFSKYYPGDDVVDWVGVSLYSGNPMSNLRQIYATYSSKKPIFVTEWATAPEKSQFYSGYPGDAKWVSEFFKSLEANYPRVKAISWFQWDKEDGNYLLQRVPEQVAAYSTAIRKPRYVEAPESGVQAASTGPTRPPLIPVANEIVLREVPEVDGGAPQRPPVEAAPRLRLKLQNVPTERVPVQR